MPGGQLPVLEVNKCKIAQSLSIARFLANKFDFAGTSPLEKAEADMIVEFSKDFYDSKFYKFTKLLYNYFSHFFTEKYNMGNF